METPKLNNPTLIAAWPGMGRVATTACYYLISKLKMEFQAEYASSEMFDADHVSVESGLVQPFRYPKNQVFSWKSPDGKNDLLVFIGEAQPEQGRYDFCRKLVDYAQREGATTIFTFAAMATNSEQHDASRVVGAATDKDTLHRFIEHDVGLLSRGSISGMNGILLGVAAERKLPGGCLLGEIPGVLMHVPYPKAAVAVLEAIGRLTNIQIDLTELKLESQRMETYLTQMLEQVQRIEGAQETEPVEAEETYIPDPVENGKLSVEEKKLLEGLFEEAKNDRAKAFELKKELDRLEVFRDYEDRFLDLFRTENDDELQS